MKLDSAKSQSMSIRSLRGNANAGLPLTLAFLATGVLSLGMLLNPIMIPLSAVSILFNVSAWLGIGTLLVRKRYLAAFYVTLFYMPLSSSLGYAFVEDYVFWNSPRAFSLGHDHAVISAMIWTGEIGLCGFLAGMLLVNKSIRNEKRSAESPARVESYFLPNLSNVVFLVLTVFAVLLSWIAAPTDTIFEEAYGTAITRGSQLNFNAGALSSYTLLILLQLDIYRTTKKSFKQTVFVCAVVYVILVLQLLRGDRESSGLIIGMLLLHVKFGTPKSKEYLKNILTTFQQRIYLIGGAVALILIFSLIGTLRSKASTGYVEKSDLSELLVRGLQQNTWTAAGVNNLALAEEYVNGSTEYFYGKTYVEYALSLPPSFVAKALGYIRPINSNNAPGLWYRYLTNGGTHPVIVPFKNFGALGLLLFTIGLGQVIGHIDRLDSSRILISQYTYGVFAVSGFKWFWYGDMNLIRSCMAAAIFYAIYICFACVREGRGRPVLRC
jgi:hypothetical protein